MRYFLLAIVSLSCFTPALADSHFKAELLGYKQCSDVVDTLDFMVKPHMCVNLDGVGLAYLVRGENLVGVKEDSANLKTLNLKDTDISTSRTGDKNYKLESFPKVSDDGKTLIFELNVNSVPIGQLGDLSFDGTVLALVSERVAEPRLEVDFSKEFEKDMGIFKVTNKTNFSDALKTGAMNMVLGGGSDTSTSLKVKGNLEAIQKVYLEVNGQEVNQNMASWHDGVKTFSFPQKINGKATIVLKYWENLREAPVTVSFK